MVNESPNFSDSQLNEKDEYNYEDRRTHKKRTMKHEIDSSPLMERRTITRRRDRRSPSQSSEPNNVIGIFGLDKRADEKDLYSLFEVFGEIDDIQVVYDGITKESRGFAFIYYKHVEDAIKAVDMCKSGQKILDREVRVDFSKTNEPHKPTPGVYMGERKSDRNLGFESSTNRRRDYSRFPGRFDSDRDRRNSINFRSQSEHFPRDKQWSNRVYHSRNEEIRSPIRREIFNRRNRYDRAREHKEFKSFKRSGYNDAARFNRALNSYRDRS